MVEHIEVLPRYDILRHATPPLPINSKGKVKLLYSIVSSPQDRSKRFTLYFPDRPVHSDTISASLGSIQPYATINARRLLVHISTTIARYSFTQLSELEQYRVKSRPQHPGFISLTLLGDRKHDFGL